jgi:hypothetical protein
VNRRQRRRNYGVLWGMILLAIIYVTLLGYLHSLTGVRALDGGMGVVLALCICVRPAINAWEWLFSSGSAGRPPSLLSEVGWLALNALVVLAGWVVLFIGLIRLVDRGA